MRILTIFSVLLFSLVAPSAFGDDENPLLKERMADVEQRLGLSDEQVEQLTPVIEQSMKAQKAVFDEYGIDPENRDRNNKLSFRQMRSLAGDMGEVRKETTAAVKEILSDDQFEEFEAMQEERRAEMRARIMGN